MSNKKEETVVQSKEEKLMVQVLELNKKLSAQNKEIAELKQTAEQRQRALNISSLQLQQYSANIETLRNQRDAFLEQWTDAGVDLCVMRTTSENTKAELESKVAELSKSKDSGAAHYDQQNAALNELRSKFGETKHAQKQAEAKVDKLTELQQKSEAAFAWYISNSNKRTPVDYMTYTDGKPLTLEVVVAAYVKSIEMGVNKAFNNSNEFVQFLGEYENWTKE